MRPTDVPPSPFCRLFDATNSSKTSSHLLRIPRAKPYVAFEECAPHTKGRPRVAALFEFLLDVHLPPIDSGGGGQQILLRNAIPDAAFLGILNFSGMTAESIPHGRHRGFPSLGGAAPLWGKTLSFCFSPVPHPFSFRRLAKLPAEKHQRADCSTWRAIPAEFMSNSFKRRKKNVFAWFFRMGYDDRTGGPFDACLNMFSDPLVQAVGLCDKGIRR
ncbi:hypothetical protein CDAR_497151 [Caerostris darwini]|uniref:Uncharacterized protein n=1 Tax=Caerostris darwini TaxID=1538125 RepID=A0AAV4S3L4_9ARAC|nr:hypothetical protein CDAR_497151 [Caerostris darwini]